MAHIIANLNEGLEYDDDEVPDHEAVFYVNDEDTDTDSKEEGGDVWNVKNLNTNIYSRPKISEYSNIQIFVLIPE